MEERRISPAVSDVRIRVGVKDSVRGEGIIGGDCGQQRRIAFLLPVAVDSVRISASQDKTINQPVIGNLKKFNSTYTHEVRLCIVDTVQISHNKAVVETLEEKASRFVSSTRKY